MFEQTVSRLALVQQSIQTRASDSYRAEIACSHKQLATFARVLVIHQRATASSSARPNPPSAPRWTDNYLKMSRLGACCAVLAKRVLGDLMSNEDANRELYAELAELLKDECCALKKTTDMVDCSCSPHPGASAQLEAVASAAAATWSGRKRLPGIGGGGEHRALKGRRPVVRR